jgi:uncharacterized membrane protein HdeD (DUF308 family)
MTGVIEKELKKIGVTMSKPVLAAICIIAGIIVIVVPAVLWIVVGLFLIIQGVLLLTEYMELNRQQQQSKSPQPSQ